MGIPLVLNCQDQPGTARSFYDKARLYAFRGVYDSSMIYFEHSSRIFEENGMDSMYIEAQVMLADVMIQKGVFDEALNKLTVLKEKINRTDPENKILRSEVYKVLGNFYLYKGQVDSANYSLQKAVDLRKAVTGKLDTAHAYMFSKKAFLKYLVGDYDSSYILYNLATQLASQKNEIKNYEISSYYQGMGIALAMKGHYKEAEISFLNSLDISKTYIYSSDPKLASTYLNLSQFYFSISKIDEAYNYLNKAEKIYLSTFERTNINLAFIYWLYGNYYFYKSGYEESISYLQEALYIFSIHLSKSDPRFKSLYMDLGVAYEKAGDLDEAIRQYKLSIEDNDSPSIIKSYRNLANAYNAQKKYNLAEETYLKSIRAGKEILGNKDRDLALSYRYYGQFLIESMYDPKGLEYYKRSLDILVAILRPDHEDIARTYLLVGEYYLLVHDLDLAKMNIDKAIELMTGTVIVSELINKTINDEISLFLTEALELRSRVILGQYYQTGDPAFLEACLADTYAAIEKHNSLKMSYSNEESKIQLMGRAKSAIYTGITAAYKLYELTADKHYANIVFELSEKSKSIVLLNSLRGLEAMKMANLPAEITEKENQLKSDLYSYNSLIYKEKQNLDPDEEKIRLWQNISFNLKKQYDSLVLSLERKYPSFYKLKYDNSVISADSAIHSLDTTEALIEFAKSDTVIFISVLTNNGIDCISVADPYDSISEGITEMIGMLKRNTMGYYTGDDFVNFYTVSYYIYSKLIKPVEKTIQSKRLIIIPDGELGYLSFDALITNLPETDEDDYRLLDYLVFRQPVSYSSSATILFGMEKQTGRGVNNRLLAFAPEYSSQEEGSTLRSSEPGIDSLRLLPIKGVEEEVDEILNIFRGTKYSGNEATELNFKRNAGKYNVLHLAMHTLIDNANPLYSKMVFTSGGNDSEDGLLNTYELFSMNLRGALGVLSACNTGSGKLEKGEGIMSLARGFIYAGIPNLVMTLWEIDDQPSADIMSGFYARLEEGVPTDIALQQAKIRYIQSTDKFKSHPTYWAGFVNIGKSDQISSSGPKSRYYWIFAVFTLFLLTFFINRQVYLRKKRD